MKTLIHQVSGCGSQFMVRYYTVLIGVMSITAWWTLGPATAGFEGPRRSSAEAPKQS